MEQKALVTVPTGLQQIYQTLSDIKNALLESVRAQSRTKILTPVYYDVELLVKKDGMHWEKAGVENIPSEGVSILLPYPNGTGPNGFRFYISHMFDKDVSHLGIKAGMIEVPRTSLERDGIRVVIKGASPVAVGWELSDEEALAINNAPLPKTGDRSHFDLFVVLFILSIVCIKVLSIKKCNWE